jgi:hypothetical protein
MPCLLRVVGDFDPEPLLPRLDWEADWWRTGDLNRRGVPFHHSGFQLVVNGAGFDEFATQLEDAVESLIEESAALTLLMNQPGVTEGVLDFGLAPSDRPAYSRRFPRGLVALAGRVGLVLELSLYAVSGVAGIR